MAEVDLQVVRRILKSGQEYDRMFRGDTLLWEKPSALLPQTKDVFSLADYTDIDGKQFQSGEIYSRIADSGALRTVGGWLKSNNAATYIRGASDRLGTQQATATLRMYRGRARLGPAVRIQPNGDCYFIAYSYNVLVLFKRVGGSNKLLKQIVAPEASENPEYENGTIHTIQVTSYTDGSFHFRMDDMGNAAAPTGDLTIPLDGGACGLRAEQDVGDNGNLSDLDIQII